MYNAELHTGKINLNYKPLNLKGGNRQIIDNSKIN